MTLALIAAIVFIVVLLIQKSNNAELKEKNRKNRETNIVEQKEIMLKWDKEISEEIDKMPPIEDYYSFFKTLYNNYNVPFFQYGLTRDEEEKENLKRKSLLVKAGIFVKNIENENNISLLNSQKMKLILHNDCDFLVSLKHCDMDAKEYRWRPFDLKPDSVDFFKDVIDMYFANMTSNKNMSLEEQKKYPKKYFFEADIIPRFYFNFIMLLTQKELASKGIYNISWNNKDSFVQEIEKNKERSDEYRKKYPWMFK